MPYDVAAAATLLSLIGPHSFSQLKCTRAVDGGNEFNSFSRGVIAPDDDNDPVDEFNELQ